MKLRNGFVSNSSSSSFIATIGRIVDTGKFEKWFNALQPEMQKEYHVDTGKEVVEIMESNSSTWRVPEFFDGDFFDYINNKKIEEEAKMHPNDLFISKDGVGPDNDGFFANEDGSIDDYDVDLDDFDDSDRILYCSSKERNGVEVIQQTYYAGRNG